MGDNISEGTVGLRILTDILNDDLFYIYELKDEHLNLTVSNNFIVSAFVYNDE